jgi:osmoprotectant transport system substrate-binding protein
LLGALSLAGVLAFAGAACTSSKSSGTSTKSGDQSSKGAGTITFRSLDAGGPLTVGALKSGSIDIAELFTFTPDIAKNGWVTLEDDKHLQAADNFVPLIRSDKNTAEIGAVIDAVDAKLTQAGLFALVKKVAVDAANPGDVAEQWLKDNKLPGDLKATGTMTVGSANFAESELVGQIYAKALKAAGVDVTFKDSVGNRQVTMPLMDKGDLDLMPEFTYSLLAYLNPKATPSNDLDAVTTQLKEALPKSLSVRKPTDVSDVNVFVVTAATAKKYDLSTLSDLAKVSDDLTLGGPPECPKNAQCIPGLKKVYGLNFKVK